MRAPSFACSIPWVSRSSARTLSRSFLAQAPEGLQLLLELQHLRRLSQDLFNGVFSARNLLSHLPSLLAHPWLHLLACFLHGFYLATDSWDSCLDGDMLRQWRRIFEFLLYRCCPSSVLKSPRRSSGYDIAGRDQIPPFINLQRDHEGRIRRGAAWAVNSQYTRSVVEGLYSPVLGLYLFMPLIELTWNGNGYTKCVASHDTRHPA